MRSAHIFVHGILAGILNEEKSGYSFTYQPDYNGSPVSLTMPLTPSRYDWAEFPPFFEGLLPEGPQLEALLSQNKLDPSDYFSHLMAVGADVVGSVTIKEIE